MANFNNWQLLFEKRDIFHTSGHSQMSSWGQSGNVESNLSNFSKYLSKRKYSKIVIRVGGNDIRLRQLEVIYSFFFWVVCFCQNTVGLCSFLWSPAITIYCIYGSIR